MKNIPQTLIIHHTSVSHKTHPKQFDEVNEYHRIQYDFQSSLGYYCGYHYFIEKNGKIIKARNEEEEGAHTLLGWNLKSIGICLAGDFYKEAPTIAQLVSLRGLIEKYKLPYMFHKNADSRRTCAGLYLTRELVDTEVPKVDEVDKEKAIRLSKQFSSFSFDKLLSIIRLLK